jgi:hypothetical protein
VSITLSLVLRERQRQLDSGETQFISWEEWQKEIDELVVDAGEPGAGALSSTKNDGSLSSAS